MSINVATKASMTYISTAITVETTTKTMWCVIVGVMVVMMRAGGAGRECGSSSQQRRAPVVIVASETHKIA